MLQSVSFALRFVEKRASAFERIGTHTKVAVDDASCTENVKLGVVPVIVHAARWNTSKPAGSDRVSLLIPVLTPNVSLVVHVDPSGLSWMVTVSCGVVPDAAVTSSFATAVPLRAQPVTAEPLPFVVRAAEATMVC